MSLVNPGSLGLHWGSFGSIGVVEFTRAPCG